MKYDAFPFQKKNMIMTGAGNSLQALPPVGRVALQGRVGWGASEASIQAFSESEAAATRQPPPDLASARPPSPQGGGLTRLERGASANSKVCILLPPIYPGRMEN